MAGRRAAAAVLLRTLLRREAERETATGRGTRPPWARRGEPRPEREGYCGRPGRDHEVAWMVDACVRLGLHVDTLSLAVAIFDTVVAEKSVRSRYANCVATASLYIAKKYCEEGDESLEEYLNSLYLAYTPNELKRMETVVLNDILGWDVLVPSLERHAVAQLQLLGMEYLAGALRAPLETVLKQGSVSSSFRPSLLALAVVSLLLEAVVRPRWLALTNSLADFLNVDMASLIAARESVGRLLPSPSPPPSARVDGNAPVFTATATTRVNYYYTNPFAPLTPDDSSEDDFGGETGSAVAVEADLVASPSRAMQPALC